MLEKQVIENCAPTLAGMKAGSLFSYSYADSRRVWEELSEINSVLNSKGVCVLPLLWRENSVLIYVYRAKLLQEDLRREGVPELLSAYGYAGTGVGACIRHLKRRLEHYDCFPHEIGIFLGYPLEDVKGFIENGGKNCKCCGVWKVYCNVGEKEKLFEKFRKCTSVYMQVFREGRELSQMTVLT